MCVYVCVSGVLAVVALFTTCVRAVRKLLAMWKRRKTVTHLLLCQIQGELLREVVAYDVKSFSPWLLSLFVCIEEWVQLGRLWQCTAWHWAAGLASVEIHFLFETKCAGSR